MSRIVLQRVLLVLGFVAVATVLMALLGRNLRFVSLLAWALVWGGLIAMLVFGPGRIVAWLRRLLRRND